MCQLLVRLNVKARGCDVQNEDVFRDTLVTEVKSFTMDELEKMVETWVDIEDEDYIVDYIIDEELDQIDKGEANICDDEERIDLNLLLIHYIVRKIKRTGAPRTFKKRNYN